ncbi:phosphoesterase family-domain-containing protein [Lipomyces oligophaga]|uniref:phosphoesterase family-domain-containing protein n=1 Tax=Lipomyces oligophaga TaxID=45792 RepID=UPI0034D00425
MYTLSKVGLALAALAPAVLAQSSSADLTPVYSTLYPSASEIAAAAATAAVGEETSSVTGSAFNRFVVIWLENTDFDAANDQSDLQWLAKSGITLTNYFSVTHPSEPNYVAAVGGDYFGMNSDNFFRIPSNVSNVVDLLDYKNISWAEYQEHQPYAGFQGFNYSNQESWANDYVRKHNPLVIYDNVATNATRLDNIKNFTSFYDDLDNKQLPQWSFITPNMTNDGHDSTIDVSGAWSRSFLTPLLNNTYFMKDTLVLLTFDENETYGDQNRIWALLLGGIIPDDLKGTTDSNFYNHYSEIATIEANWDLPHLGRGDIDANVFSIVANSSDVAIESIDYSNIYNNFSAPGYYNDDTIAIPPPNVDAVNRNGQSILPAIKSVWSSAYSVYSASTASSSLTYSAETDNFASSGTPPSSTATGSSGSSAATTADSTLSTEVTGSATATDSSASASETASGSSSASSSSSSGAAGHLAPATGLLGLVLAALAMF